MTFELFHPKCLNTKCPLHFSCSRIPSEVQRSAFSNVDDPVDFLFVTDHPSSREMISRRPFKGPERNIIEKIFKKHAPEKTFAFTYLVRGWPIDEKSLKEYHKNRFLFAEDIDTRWIRSTSFTTHPNRTEIINSCQNFLLQDIKKWKPGTIVVMGNIVKEALLPQESLTITRLFNVVSRNFHGIPLRFMTTPKSLLQNPSSKRHWETQIKAIAHDKIADLDTEVGKDFLITDIDDALDYIEILKETKNPISVDLETLNLNKRYGNKIATIQFAETVDSGVTIPYQHPDTPFTPDEQKRLKNALFDLFHTPSKIPFWIGHNLKFECNVLKAVIGTSILSAPMFDTMVGAFLVDENRRERAAEFRYGVYTLKQLAYDYLGFDGYDQGVLANRSDGNLFELPLDQLSSYGAMDVYITRRLYHSIIEEAEYQNYLTDLNNLMFKFYTPCIRLASDLEQNGFYVGKNHLRELVSPKSLLLTEMDNIENEIKNSKEGIKANEIIIRQGSGPASRIVPLGNVPWVFDLAKGGHPQVLFFNVLGLEPGKVGKSGVPSVDSAWQNNNKGNKFVAKFSEWQGYRILYNTFATKLYERIDPRGSDVDCNQDCRIRSDFLTTGPVTGRWASRNPNLQNIPRGDTIAKRAIKNIFQAMPGHFLVQLDYKANEVRWVGILAQDESLARAIWEGYEMFQQYRKNPSKELLFKAKTYGDIHRQTASMIFNKPLEDITKGERQATKSCVFAILYGSSVRSVAEDRQKSLEEVQSWFDQFYERFPKISQWKKRMEEHAMIKGFVSTPNGRRRRFPLFDLFRDEFGIFDSRKVSAEDEKKIAECVRQSVNAPIQGIASDSGMLGAALFAEYIRDHNKEWLLSNAVHDSCVYQVPYDQLEESLGKAEYFFTEKVMYYMSEHFGVKFNLPLEIDFEIGLSWGGLKEWDYSPTHLEKLKLELLNGKGKP